MNEPQAVSLERVMHDNYCFNLKMEQYAALCNRSLSAFKRDFQKQFNSTPGKWLLEKRLQHSMTLLKNTGKTVAEAAFESGFENNSHFSRCFKQRFGLTPWSPNNQWFPEPVSKTGGLQSKDRFMYRPYFRPVIKSYFLLPLNKNQ